MGILKNLKIAYTLFNEFYEALLKNETLKENLTIFFSTHSNHLLDISIESYDKISILFEKSIKQMMKYFH
jgi:hypothetical protein